MSFLRTSACLQRSRVYEGLVGKYLLSYLLSRILQSPRLGKLG